MMPPGVHLLDISGPAHIFYEAASYGAPVKQHFSSIFTDETGSTSSCSLTFSSLVPFDQLNLNAGDLVFIPGLESSLLLDDDFLLASDKFREWMRVQYQNGVIICSVCTGAFLVAEAGLLNGRSCTTHWKYTDLFSHRYPKAKLLANRLFVDEDRIFTSAGVSSGIDLALHLVEKLWGAHFAAKVAKEVVIYFRRSMDDPQLSVFTQYRNHLEYRIHNVQDRLAETLDQKISVEQLAEQVSMSPRNLTRLFKKTTDITIGAYLGQLRAERARQLKADGQTMHSVAAQCGLKSTNQLRSILKKVV
jgi:transcriptional regulator GlxA family with amidase domain